MTIISIGIHVNVVFVKTPPQVMGQLARLEQAVDEKLEQMEMDTREKPADS